MLSTATAAAAADGAVTAKASGKSSRVILIGLIVAVSMSSIDQTIVSLSSQAIQSGLGLTASGVEWVVNAYLLAAAAAFPLAGRLSDMVGYKRLMLLGVVVFGAGSLLCGLAPAGSQAFVWMVASRVVQGLGLALMFPSAIGIVFSYSPVNRRASSMATFFAITGAMTAVGPIAGSYFIKLSWRYVFFINLPLAVAAVVLVALLVPADRHADFLQTLRRLDWPGAVMAAAAMVALIVPLQQGNAVGWSDPRIIGSLVASVALFAVFALIEIRVDNPILNVRVFSNLRFSLSSLANLVASISFIPIMYFLSVYGQLGLAQSVSDTSLMFLYFFLGFLVASKFGAALFSKRGIRSVLVVAGIVTVLGFAWLSRSVGGPDVLHGLGLDGSLGAVLGGTSPTSVGSLSAVLIVSGAGIGFMFSPTSTDMVNRGVGSSYGEVTALTQMLKNFGGALGMAVFSSLCSTVFANRVFTGLHSYGVTHQMAKDIAASVGSGSRSGASTHMTAIPASARASIMATVRGAYSTAAGTVFLAMAAAGVVFLVLAVMYPREKAMHEESDAA
ncbi:MAG: MFS transporter [Bifidobacterium sp.]|jgi:MFS family permease|nr:MFS transporter [Bifidobacterium sp.]MCI1864949.1 MFS transporter [Bifidobacterium sp.]